MGAEYLSDDLLGMSVVLNGISWIIAILDEIFQSDTSLDAIGLSIPSYLFTQP